MIKAAQYSTHIPCLLKALRMTSGDVLEIGSGYFSTPIIHLLCVPRGRRVVTMESDPNFIPITRQFEGPLHTVELVNNWDEARVDGHWGLAMVDHHPPLRRREEVTRLADCAELIVLHDTSPEQDHVFQYSVVWPLFRWIYHHWDIFPGTSLLSNHINLDGLNIWE